jgi:cytidylate kinase
VKLVAPRENRVRYAMEAEQLELKAAEKFTSDTDSNRARYHRQYYKRDWDDPVHYHMVLNTGLLGFEGAAAVVVAVARTRGW